MTGLVLGLKKIEGSPFITIFAGIMMFAYIAITQSIAVGYSDAQPSNSTQSGGALTCVTTTNTICTPTAITKSFSYFNSTSQLTNKPDPIPQVYNIQQENSWVYLSFFGVFWLILGIMVFVQKW